jgi:hypothetical protein
MQDNKLSQDSLDELEHLIVPLMKRVKTFEDLTTIATYIDELIRIEDTYE